MSKAIVRIDYDADKASEGIPFKTYIIEEIYEKESTGDDISVVWIEEIFTYGKRTFIVHFDDSSEFEITDMYHIYKEIVKN